jgi:hypothetical protein
LVKLGEKIKKNFGEISGKFRSFNIFLKSTHRDLSNDTKIIEIGDICSETLARLSTDGTDGTDGGTDGTDGGTDGTDGGTDGTDGGTDGTDGPYYNV